MFNILAQCNGSSFLELEPFTKREALNWLIGKTTNSTQNNKINISIRSLAKIWNWHKSKVERFIKNLKEKSVIKTAIEAGKTSITICNLATFKRDEAIAETTSEPVIETKHLEKPKQDNIWVCSECLKAKRLPSINTGFMGMNEIVSRQNRDSFIKKNKKEKNQKKKKEKNLKEKNIPFGDIKKEKMKEVLDVDFSTAEMDEIKDFASSIAFEPEKIDCELAKFKDHLNSGYTRPPKYALPAFRNWLRRAVEFNRFRRRNEQNSKIQSGPTSYERFLAASARALAERKKRRLDGIHAREWSIFGPESTSNKQIFPNLQPVN